MRRLSAESVDGLVSDSFDILLLKFLAQIAISHAASFQFAIFNYAIRSWII